MKTRQLAPLLLFTSLLACSAKDITDTQEKAQKLAGSVRENIPTSLEDLEKTRFVAETLEKVDVRAGIQAIQDQDLGKATEFCGRLDSAFGTTVFTTYSQACERDLREGTDLAIKLLELDIAKVELPHNDRVALEATRDAALKAKSLFNRDIFVLLLLFYLDNKYPHMEWAKFLAPLLLIKPLAPDKSGP